MAQPNPVLLFHDKRLLGRDNVVSVTSEASRFAGVSVAGLSNEGDLFPLAFASTVTEDYAVDLGLVRAGGLYRQAEWMWKDQTDADTGWRGVDQITYLANPHDPFAGFGSTREVLACCFAKRLNRIFLYWLTNGTAPASVQIRYRDVGGSPTQWTSTTTTLERDCLRFGGSMEVLEMPDGSLRMLVVSGNEGSADNDVDVYCSTDGITWTLGARNVITKSLAADLRITKMRAAVSGDWIRMVTVDGVAADTHCFVSADYGASFLELSDLDVSVADNGQNNDEFGAFDLEGLDDDAGTFVLAWRKSTENNVVTLATASRDEDWTEANEIVSFVAPEEPFRVCLTRTATHIVCLVVSDDGDTRLLRGAFVAIESATSFADWEMVTAWNGAMGVQTAKYHPRGMTACEADGGFLVMFGLCDPDSSGDDVDYGGLIYGQVWSSRTMWNEEVVDENTASFTIQWDSLCGGPVDYTPTAGVTWGQFAGVNSSETWVPDYWTIQSTNAVNGHRYQGFQSSAATSWADTGNMFEWIMRFPAGWLGAANDDRAAVRIRALGASAGVSLDFSVRHGQQTITVYDNGIGQTALTLSVTGLTTTFHVVRAAIGLSGTTRQVELAACPVDELGDGWTSGVANLTSTAVGVTFQGFEWGALIGNAAMTQHWRRFGFSDSEDWHQHDFENPTTLRGAPVSAAPWAMRSGVHIQWSGGAGFELDRWTNEVRHHYEVENIFLPSPQSPWRSTSLSSQAIVFDADPTNGRGVFDHAGMAIYGTSHRGVRVDYNATNAWATPSSTTTLNADLVTGLTVSLVGNGFVEVAGATLVEGAYDGKYLHFTSGAYANASLTISAQVANRLYLSSSFDVSSVVSAGASCLIHDDKIVELYTSRARFRYMRISLANITTATGDARIGHIVAGQTYGFDQAAVDWEHTQTDESGVELEVGFQGLRWGFEAARPRRVIECAVTGDANRVREAVGNQLRNWQQLSVRPLCFVWDRDDTPASALLVRFDGNLEFENTGWRQAPNGTWHPVGTQGFQFSEEL